MAFEHFGHSPEPYGEEGEGLFVQYSGSKIMEEMKMKNKNQDQGEK